MPATTDATPSVFVTARSAETEIVVFCDAELLAGTGSAVAALTVAVFVYVPPGAAAAVVDEDRDHPRRGVDERRDGCT